MILPPFRLPKLQFRESPMVQEKRANNETQRRQARAAIRFLRAWGFRLLMCLPIGCVVNRSELDQALRTDRGAATRNEGVADHYLVACPDVLDIAVTGRPEISGRRPVEPDGCVDLGKLGRVHVEELPLPEVARRIVNQAGVAPQTVAVRVAEFGSQQIYLIGEVRGLQRAIPYRGPETVLDLLQRTGGITPGAEPEHVYVIRSRIADGRPPEVFHIDLPAILIKKDQRSNIRLQPFDQVFVGEARQSIVDRCMPPFLRPVYQAVSGFRRGDPKIEESRN